MQTCVFFFFLSYLKDDPAKKSKGTCYECGNSNCVMRCFGCGKFLCTELPQKRRKSRRLQLRKEAGAGDNARKRQPHRDFDRERYLRFSDGTRIENTCAFHSHRAAIEEYFRSGNMSNWKPFTQDDDKAVYVRNQAVCQYVPNEEEQDVASTIPFASNSVLFTPVQGESIDSNQ